MEQTTDNRLKIFIIIAVILVFVGIIAGIIISQSDRDLDVTYAKLKIDQARYDFGDVSMANGLVSHTFNIINEGAGELKISNIKTSCMCTSAVLEVNGQKSPKFGMHNNPTFWSKYIKPGQTANLNITFDPLAHGPDATGPVTRTVTITTDNGTGADIKSNFTFTANVIK